MNAPLASVALSYARTQDTKDTKDTEEERAYLGVPASGVEYAMIMAPGLVQYDRGSPNTCSAK